MTTDEAGRAQAARSMAQAASVPDMLDLYNRMQIYQQLRMQEEVEQTRRSRESHQRNEDRPGPPTPSDRSGLCALAVRGLQDFLAHRLPRTALEVMEQSPILHRAGEVALHRVVDLMVQEFYNLYRQLHCEYELSRCAGLPIDEIRRMYERDDISHNTLRAAMASTSCNIDDVVYYDPERRVIGSQPQRTFVVDSLPDRDANNSPRADVDQALIAATALALYNYTTHALDSGRGLSVTGRTSANVPNHGNTPAPISGADEAAFFNPALGTTHANDVARGPLSLQELVERFRDQTHAHSSDNAQATSAPYVPTPKQSGQLRRLQFTEKEENHETPP